MKVFLDLFIEFFQIGLFAIGGGPATIPFLIDIPKRHDWYQVSDVANMLAVSESTPGPIGINMATYVGYKVGGVFGGIVATLSEIAPAIIIIILIIGILDKFKENVYVKSAFEGIRPTVFGLIISAFIGIFTSSVIFIDKFNQTGVIGDLLDIRYIGIFLIVFLCNIKWKIHPIFYVLLSAILGIILL